MSVYHRNCLTQIEIFRFIGIHFASDGGCELRIQACAPASTMAPGKGAITAPHLPLPDHVRHFALVFLLGLLSLKLGFAHEGTQSRPNNARSNLPALRILRQESSFNAPSALAATRRSYAFTPP